MQDELDRKPDDDESEGDADAGIGILRARETLGDLVNRAGFGNDRIVIRRNGKPIAAIVGMKDLERLRALDREPATTDAA